MMCNVHRRRLQFVVKDLCTIYPAKLHTAPVGPPRRWWAYRRSLWEHSSGGHGHGLPRATACVILQPSAQQQLEVHVAHATYRKNASPERSDLQCRKKGFVTRQLAKKNVIYYSGGTYDLSSARCQASTAELDLKLPPVSSQGHL